MSRPVVLTFLGDGTGLEAVFAQIEAAAAGLEAKLSTMGQKIQAFGQGMSSVGSSLTRYVTLPVLAVAGASIFLAARFDESMQKIVGLVGVSQKQVDAWSKSILQLGNTLPQGPKELADALFFVTSAGFRGAAAMDVLVASAKAAAAGLGTTMDVANAVTSAVNAYGQANLSASRATDVMVATVRDGKMPTDQLASALGRVLAPAQAVGISFDQVGASIASMTREGLSADEASTATRQMLMGFIKPSKQAADAFKSVGLSVADVQNSLRDNGLIATLDMLRAKTDGNTTTFAKMIPNVRALNGALILTGANSKDVNAVFKDLANSTGATDSAFAAASKTGAFAFKQALTQLKDMAIEIGSILMPVFVKLMGGIGGLVGDFSKLDGPTKQWAVGLALVAAAVGPVLKVLGPIVSLFGFIVGSPVAMVVLAIAAAAAVAYRSWAPFKDLIDKSVVTLKDLFRAVATGDMSKVGQDFTKLISPIRTAIDTVKQLKDVMALVSGFNNPMDKVGNANKSSSGGILKTLGEEMRKGFDAGKQAFTGFMAWFKSMEAPFAELWKHIVSVVAIVWRNIAAPLVDIATNAVDAVLKVFVRLAKIIEDIISVVVDLLNGDWGKAWNALYDIVKQIFGAIGDIVKGAIGQIVDIMRLGVGIVVSIWQLLFNMFHNVGSTVGDAMKSAFNAVVNAVGTAIKAVLGFVAALPGQVLGFLSKLPGIMVSTAARAFQDLADAAGYGIAAFLGIMVYLPVKALEAIANLPAMLRDLAIQAFGLFENGVSVAVTWVVNTMIALPGKIVAALSALGNMLWTIAKAAFGFFVSAVVTAATDVYNVVVGLPNKIVAALGSLGATLYTYATNAFGQFTSAVSTAATKIVSIVSSLPGLVSNAVGGLWGGLVVGFKAAINAIIGLWDSIHFSIPAIVVAGVTVFPGVNVSTPHIGFMAEGGLVPGSAGGSLRILGERNRDELVLPIRDQSRTSALLTQYGLAGGSGQHGASANAAPQFILQQTITALDPRDAARQSAEEWSWYAKTRGY